MNVFFNFMIIVFLAPLLYSQDKAIIFDNSLKPSLTHKELEELYQNHTTDIKEVKHHDYSAHQIFKGTEIDGKVYTGINVLLDFDFTKIQYFFEGDLYRDKWILNDNNNTVIADGYIRTLTPWKGTFVGNSDLDTPFRTVATIIDGVQNGKVTTYDSSFKTIIAEGFIISKKEKEGTFFESIAFVRGLANITTFVKNEIKDKIWFDEVNKNIFAKGKYKNRKPFNGSFIEFQEIKGDDLPPPIMNVYHFKDGKKIETLSGKDYFTKNKKTFTDKIKSKPTPKPNALSKP